MTASAYFQRLSETDFAPTAHVGGFWRSDEQHIAPSVGLLTHLIERDRDARRGDDLRTARVVCDILGVLTMDPVEVTVRVIRPGRTIELVEAELRQHDRAAVLLRAWQLQRGDTAALAATGLDRMPAPDTFTATDDPPVRTEGFVPTVEVRRVLRGEGHAHAWLRPHVPLLEDEPISSTARLLGVIDIANGMATLADSDRVAFPNIDLAVSLARDPDDGWIGLETRTMFGPDGTGLTESVLHDAAGPVGTLSQTLTVRPLG